MQIDITLDLIKELILDKLGVPNYSHCFYFEKQQSTLTIEIPEYDFEFYQVSGTLTYNFNTSNIQIIIGFNDDDNIFHVLVQKKNDFREFYFGIRDTSLEPLSNYLTV